jgi:hypothetical protein
MKKSIKAVLWSGLAFPGAGHFYLKRYLRGLIVFVPAVASIGLYVQGLMEQVDFVMGKIESGTVALDPAAIEAVLNSAPQSQVVEVAFWVFVACWVAGMVDAYLLGRSLETTVATNDSVAP